MTQYPPQPPYSPSAPQPLGYGQYYPRYNPRPTSVTVVAILGIIFGGLRVLCTPIGLVPFFIPINASTPNPVLDAYRADPKMLAILIAQSAVIFVLGAWLVAGSIAALLLKSWGRRMLISYALAQVIVVFAGLVVHYTIVMPRLSAALANAAGKAVVGLSLASTVVGAVLSLIIPTLLLVIMTRPHVAAAFESANNDPGAAPPQQPYGYAPPPPPPQY
jgi:hypothetical protein